MKAAIAVVAASLFMSVTGACALATDTDVSSLYTQSTDGPPENAVILKDIFTDDFIGCAWGGWTLLADITDDNVKVGEKSFKVSYNENGQFGQGGITFDSTISGNNEKIQAAIKSGIAYVGMWQYIQKGTSWMEVRLNQDRVLRAVARDAWEYVSQPLTEAGNDGRFIYVKNQSVKEYWIDQIQLYMIPPEDTSMVIKSVSYKDQEGEDAADDNVYVSSDITVEFPHYIMKNSASAVLMRADDSTEIPANITYDNNKLVITPVVDLDYDTNYNILLSGAKNMFDVDMEESEISFKTAKPLFRLENVKFYNGDNEISEGDVLTAIKCTADVVNDSYDDELYKLIFVMLKGGEIVKIESAPGVLCESYSTEHMSVDMGDFGEIKADADFALKAILLDENQLEVMDKESTAVDSFSESTLVTLSGDNLKINAEMASKEKRRFTMAMLKFDGEAINWNKPGYILCSETDENGVFSAERKISEYTASGNYALIIWAEGVETPYVTYAYYTGKDKRDEVTATIKNGTAADILALMTNGDNAVYLKSMGIMYDEFNLLTQNADYVAQEMQKLTEKEKQDEKSCVKALNRYIILAQIKEADDKTEKFISLKEKFGIEERINNTISQIINNGKLECFSALFDNVQYTSISDFENKLLDVVYIAGLNAVAPSDYNSVLAHLNTYSDILGFKIKDKFGSESISGYNQIQILKSLIGKGYTQKQQIYNDIIAGISKYRPQQNVGGGGGSSTNKSNSKPVNYTMTSVTAIPDAAEENDPVPQFSDMNEALWAKSSIIELVAGGIIEGYDDNTFRPNQNITRAEFVKILMGALFEESHASENSFDDVPMSHWAYSYIQGALEIGIVSGISERIFSPDTFITREQMATMCARAIAVSDIAVAEKNTSEGFSDFNDVSLYAKKFVTDMKNWGFMVGDDNGKFNPKNFATRAETAQVIYNIISMKGGSK